MARPRLSRDRVLRAAFAVVDESGLESLSMRKLAQQLDVEAMSLYNHVASKDDIVDGLIDLVAAEAEPPADEADWRSALRHGAISVHGAFARHPWAARVWMSSGTASPHRMRYADAVLRCLRGAGFSGALIYHAYHVLEGYALGFALQELSFPYEREELERLAARFLRDFPVDDYPDLAEHVRQHAQPPRGAKSAFEFGLDLILDGLEGLRAAGEARPPRR